jgi:hypothetical protein
LPSPKFDVSRQKKFLRDAQRDMEEERACEELQHETERLLEEDRIQEQVQRVT